MQHHHADFRPHDKSRSSFRRSADRLLASAKKALLDSGSSVGPHLTEGFSGARVAAYLAGAKVRFEVVTTDGGHADYHSGGASRALASLAADSFS